MEINEKKGEAWASTILNQITEDIEEIKKYPERDDLKRDLINKIVIAQDTIEKMMEE